MLPIEHGSSEWVLSHEQAVQARKQFVNIHTQGKDDELAPGFYKEVIGHFSKTMPKEVNETPIGFIVVANMMHTAPYFLETVASLADILALVPKHSKVVKDVEKSLKQIFRNLIDDNINRDVLASDSVEDEDKTRHFLKSVFEKQKAGQPYRIIILDHGGYFAKCLAKAMVDEKFCPKVISQVIGIVEHTYNGEVAYNEIKRPFPFPLLSIAHSALKDHESNYVAQSIVDAITVKILSGEGLNQEIGRLKMILIIGYGRIGSRVARYLKSLSSV